MDGGWAKGLLTAFERTPSPDAVFGAVAPADELGTAYCRFDGSEDRTFRGTGTPPWHIGTGGNMAFRREVIVGVGGFDPTFGIGAEAKSADETELMLRLLGAGCTLVWTPDMRVYHPSKHTDERIASRRTYGFGMGRALRRHRRVGVTAKYLVETAHVSARALARRDGARLREAATQVAAFTSGIVKPRTWLSPLSALAQAPPEVREQVADAELVPLPAPDRPRPHFLYAVGADRILHAYVSPVPGLGQAFECRAELRRELTGVPRDVVIAAGRDSLWVLEERLPGEHPSPNEAAAWFDRVAAWAVALAGAPARPLRETGSLAAGPPDLHAAVAEAHAVVGDLRSVRVHGDLSRKNVLVDATHVGAVDWEDCAPEGVPGRDILFLAVGATADRPDAAVIHSIARGENPPFGDVVGPLAQLGVGPDAVRPLLLTVLAGWAADEERRLSELGSTSRERPYLELLTACAEELTSRS